LNYSIFAYPQTHSWSLIIYRQGVTVFRSADVPSSSISKNTFIGV
jgi:hypothetical protein